MDLTHLVPTVNRLGVLALSGLLGACGGSSQPSPAQLFSPAIGRVVLEVDYTARAKPITGRLPAITNVWSLFSDNAARLFEGKKALDVPTQLSQMEEIPEPAGDEFRQQQILDLAAAHRQQRGAADTAAFYALWLPGYYHDGDKRRTDVLGVSFGDTGVIAMFKPVIDSTAALQPLTAFIEQSVLVHEFGHAAGLVNRGVPLSSAHHDAAHGAHCTQTECVMNYLNEGPSEALGFATRRFMGSDTALYGPECLKDASALAASLR